MKVSLRDYQVQAFDEVRERLRQGDRRIMLSLPTGGGKTVVAAALIEAATQKHSKVVFIADRVSLVRQTSMRLNEYGISHGIMRANMSFGRYSPVQVCSAQTAERREWFPEADLIIVDEAHTMRKGVVKHLLDTDTPTLGLSATPFPDGLGDIYQSVVNSGTADMLTENGWLVPLKPYIATEVDGAGARGIDSEVSGNQASHGVIPIVGDIVQDWFKWTQKHFDRPPKTLVFSPTVDDGEKLCQEFRDAGERFEQISYKTGSDEDRMRKIEGLEKGEITGLISCEALARGFDVADVQCLVSARIYRSSLAAHLQQLGRVMRPAPGKDFALVLDHVGNYLRFAPAAEAFWAEGIDSLNPAKVKELTEKAKEEQDRERKCLDCGYVLPKGADMCPSCGRAIQRKPLVTPRIAGEMQEYVKLSDEVGDIWPHVCRLALDLHKGDLPKANTKARVMYKNLAGRWPAWERPFTPAERADARVRQAEQRRFKAWRRAQGG